MANLKVIGALAVSAAFAMASPAMAQHRGGGGGGFHGGGGGGFHGGGGMHAGGFGGGMRAAVPSGGGFHAAAVGGGGAPRAAMATSSFRNANASMGTAAPSFAGRSAVVANNGGGNWNGGWHNGGWRHHGYRPGIGFAAGLAAGSALGYGYGGYYDGYYADNGYYGDDYAYNDGDYDTGVTTGYVVSTNADPASCAQRYRSYDPASGTYLGYDGLRRPCGE